MRKDERAPDSVQPLLGWRVWHLAADALLKPLVVHHEAWTPGPNEARCHRPNGGHSAPGPNCVCGFNALHAAPHEFRGDAGHAVGVIAAWGDIDVYKTGFRAQFAAVLGLLDDAPTGTLHAEKLAAAAHHYAVPLLAYPELRAHASNYARPTGGHLQPGARLAAPATGEEPIPLAASPQEFKGRGVWVHSHLAVDHDGRFMRLGPTPSLAALTDDAFEPQATVGAHIAEGAPLFKGRARGSRIPIVSPVAGQVLAINEGIAEYEEGPAAGGWLVELRLDHESLDASPIAWGRPAAEAYRDYVLASGSDADLLLTCGEDPTPAATLLDPDEGRGWLRAFAQQLDTAIRADANLCTALTSLGKHVVYDVAGLESVEVAAPAIGERWVRTGAGEASEEADLHIELRPDDLRRYWRGELGLDPDHVSGIGVEGLGGARGPLHLLAGSRGDLLLVLSLQRRVFAAATEILEGLGNPWFKAGDAIGDPVRNLEVLAGFSPPGGLSGAA